MCGQNKTHDGFCLALTVQGLHVVVAHGLSGPRGAGASVSVMTDEPAITPLATGRNQTEQNGALGCRSNVTAATCIGNTLDRIFSMFVGSPGNRETAGLIFSSSDPPISYRDLRASKTVVSVRWSGK